MITWNSTDRSVRTSVRLAAAVLALLLGGAPAAIAQTWGSVDLPGGVTAARRVLALGTETRTDSAFLVDFIRTFHKFGDVDSKALDRFERYFRYVQQLQGALAVWRDGVVLGSERLRGPARDRWRTVAELMGLRLREVKNRPVLEVDRGEDATQRIAWLKALGVDVPTLAAQLNKGDKVALAIPTDPLPLPLPAVWPALLGQGGPPDVVKLGASHKPALIYVGLMSLDSETLAWVGRHPEALDLNDDAAGTFAAFGRSVRVRGNLIDVPGGAAFAPVWVERVDRRLDEPGDFIHRLLTRDDGRLAFLYDTVDHLSPALQTALFEGATSTHDRQEALDRQYRWFRDVAPAWKVGVRPFFRPDTDPSLVYALLDIASDGTVGPPWWPRLLEKVTEDDDWPERPLREIAERKATLTWVLQWLVDAKDATPRLRLLQFAQRRFKTAARAQAGAVETALRAHERMPALAIALERMGVADPAVYAAVANAAMRVTTSGDAGAVDGRLRIWQSALGVLEQVMRWRSVAPEARDALLTGLARTVPAEGGWAPGAVGRWVVEAVMPAIGTAPAGDRRFETGLFAAWLTGDRAASRTFTWEGLEYRIDRIGPVVRDASAVRAAAKGPTLESLQVLVGVRQEMAAGVKALDRARDIAARLQGIRKTLMDLRNDEKKPLYDTHDLDDAARSIAKIKNAKDLSKVGRQVDKVLDAIDLVSAHVLPAVDYALAASPTPQPQLFSDSALRHAVIAVPTAPAHEWRRAAWAQPVTGAVASGGSAIQGALLTLDAALADGQLRRAAAADGGLPPAEGTFNPADRDAMLQRLLLHASHEALEAAGQQVLEAAVRGRERWTQLTRTRSAANEASLRAVIGETRANLVLWLEAQKRFDAIDEILLPTERVYLGADGPLPPGIAVASTVIDGCFCLRTPPRRPVWEWVGRGDSGHLSLMGADLQVRLIEALSSRKLPLYLVDATLPMALQDTLDRVGQFSPEDWEALAVSRFIPDARVDDYLLTLVSEGILASPKPGGQQ